MRKKAIFLAMVLAFMVALASAQNVIPAGYTRGTITLANGTILNGFIKDNMRKSSAVSYIDVEGKNRKQYAGSEINMLSADTLNFICIQGDFFKIICAGKLNFLQKASSAPNKIFYNGGEPILSNGTAGKIGDYFIYKNNELIWLNKKNIESFINNDLAGYGDAIQKANAINGDIAKLESAVDSYNIYHK